MSAAEAEVLRTRLERVKAARYAKKLELVSLSAEAWRLEKRLRQLVHEEDDSSNASLLSDEDVTHNWKWPVLPATELLALPTVAWLAGPQTVASQTHAALDKVEDEPPCAYSCFRAKPAILADLATMACHWRRSFEITNLSSINLASEAEKSLLRERYSFMVMEQHAVVNFMVWRRSVLLLVLLACLGAFIFSLVGDTWTAFSHMEEMRNISKFEVSFEHWRHQTIEQLPYVSCADIDANFETVLKSMSIAHEVVALSCTELLQHGIGCDDLVEKVVVGCWQPSLCHEAVHDHCPQTCAATDRCRDTRDSGSFDYRAFTIAFTKAMLYMLIEQLSKAELQKLMFSMAAKLVASILMLQATIHWGDWHRSNRLALWAWLVISSSPFLRSIVPTPLLIDWGPIDIHMERFVNMTDEHFDLTNRMTQLAHVAGLSCNGHHMEEKMANAWETAHHKVHWWCDKVKTGAKWLPWSQMLQKGALECQLLTNYMGVGDVATVQAQVQKERLCRLINNSRVKEPLSSVREAVDVGWIRSATYALVGSLSSLLAFRVVLPEALSVAPGLLAAAIRIKVVAPQSYLPGVFIAVMPLLYVPMIWSFSILVVQSVGDPLLLIGITLLAFSPMAYTIFGAWRHVTSPMSTNGARAFITCVQRCTGVMHAIAVLCISAYVVKLCWRLRRIEESRKGIAAFLLDEGRQLLLPLLVGHIDSLVSLVTSGPLWSLVFTFYTQVYLTAIVGSDWMLHASAEEWDSQGNECYEELQDRGNFEDVNARTLHKQRDEAMQAMLELTEKRRRLRPGH